MRFPAPPADYRCAAGAISIVKRGMKGVYQHCDEAHLHRYLAELDIRYNNRTALDVSDDQRTITALVGVTGKRLTYQGLTKPALERSAQVTDEVKRAIRDILYMRWIAGKD